jgi:predicted esterase
VREHHLRVARTARYHTLGDPATARAIWVVVHGYGQLARFFLNKFKGLEDGLLIAAPEGLSRFYLDNAHQRVGATWMTREDREREIDDHIHYLDLLVQELLHTTGPRPVHALGFSQGVATVSRWNTSGSTRVSRLVLWGGSLPPDIDTAAMQHWTRSRVDVVQGVNDDIVPGSVAEQTVQRLSSAGIVHQLHQHRAGHALDTLLLGSLLRPE